MRLNLNSGGVSVITNVISSKTGADPSVIRTALLRSLCIIGNVDEHQTGDIDEEAFAACLIASDICLDDEEPILGAAVLVRPFSLQASDHEEGMIAALAQQISSKGSELDVDEDATKLALSVNFCHDGGNEFSCKISSREDYAMTIMVGNGQDDSQVRAVLMREISALRRLVSEYDTDWIENYMSKEDEEVTRGTPTFDPRIVVSGLEVKVWPGAVSYTKYDSVGNVVGVEVVTIDSKVFELIGEALHAMDTIWTNNAHTIEVIREIVPLASDDMKP